jgi:Ca2+-binding EF-hand superfamily protein
LLTHFDKQALVEALTHLDLDGDGFLNHEELLAFLETFSEHKLPEWLHHIFEDILTKSEVKPVGEAKFRGLIEIKTLVEEVWKYGQIEQ